MINNNLIEYAERVSGSPAFGGIIDTVSFPFYKGKIIDAQKEVAIKKIDAQREVRQTAIVSLDNIAVSTDDPHVKQDIAHQIALLAATS